MKTRSKVDVNNFELENFGEYGGIIPNAVDTNPDDQLVTSRPLPSPNGDGFELQDCSAYSSKRLARRPLPNPLTNPLPNPLGDVELSMERRDPFSQNFAYSSAHYDYVRDAPPSDYNKLEHKPIDMAARSEKDNISGGGSSEASESSIKESTVQDIHAVEIVGSVAAENSAENKANAEERYKVWPEKIASRNDETENEDYI